MTAPAVAHPTWCDPAWCTADPAAVTAAGYRAGSGGQHRSAPIRLDLGGAVWLPAPEGTACLTESVAPWSCAPFLRVQVGAADLSMPADLAGPVLLALSALTGLARVGEVAR